MAPLGALFACTELQNLKWTRTCQVPTFPQNVGFGAPVLAALTLHQGKLFKMHCFCLCKLFCWVLLLLRVEMSEVLVFIVLDRK